MCTLSTAPKQFSKELYVVYNMPGVLKQAFCILLQSHVYHVATTMDDDDDKWRMKWCRCGVGSKVQKSTTRSFSKKRNNWKSRLPPRTTMNTVEMKKCWLKWGKSPNFNFLWNVLIPTIAMLSIYFPHAFTYIIWKA